MGVIDTITFDRRPQQGSHLGRACDVVFHYDSSRRLPGRIIRDDVEAPGKP